MSRILLVISMVCLLAGCGKEPTASLTQDQLHRELQGYGVASRKMVGNEVEKQITPLKEEMKKLESNVKEHVTNEAGLTRQEVGNVGRTIISNQDKILEQLSGNDRQLQEIYRRVETIPLTAGSTSVPSAGLPTVPATAEIGTVSTEATVNGVTVKFSGPGSWQQAQDLLREQQIMRDEARQKSQERAERVRMINALINRGASYNSLEPRVRAVESRISVLEEQLPTALVKIESELTRLGTGFDNLTGRLATFQQRIEHLAKACNTPVKYAAPVPMPPNADIYRCQQWYIYPNHRTRCLNVWVATG